jgi:hypothetical protein
MSFKLLLAIAIVVGSFFAGKRMFQGALISILGAFPAVGLVALVYGFPIPFSGNMQGLDAVLPSMFAVVTFGLYGGFLVLAVLGVAAAQLPGLSAEATRRGLTF